MQILRSDVYFVSNMQSYPACQLLIIYIPCQQRILTTLLQFFKGDLIHSSKQSLHHPAPLVACSTQSSIAGKRMLGMYTATATVSRASVAIWKSGPCLL